MRAIFSIVSLLVVLAIVGILVKKQMGSQVLWDPLESTCRHASLSIL